MGGCRKSSSVVDSVNLENTHDTRSQQSIPPNANIDV
jgi:hypothetical protein